MAQKRPFFLLAVLIIGWLSGCAKKGSETTGEAVRGELASKVDLYLSRISPFGFSGALFIAKGDDILLNKGYGMAIESAGIRNTAETVFDIGSVTKQFTAAAIMKLEMMGKLNTDDPISKYIEGVPNDKSDIKLFHLLTHTSGVIDSGGPDFLAVERDETVKKALDAPLHFIVGERFSYSNLGYSLLAAIIERVSGRPYEEFLREELFIPAGMYFTGYRLPSWNERLVAHQYAGEKDNRTPLGKPYPYWNLLGNGGILSTTGDMFRWHKALLGDRVLSAEAKKKLYTPNLNDYAFGWDFVKTPRGVVIKHNGGSSMGVGAEFRRYIDAEIVFILLSNKDGIDVLFQQGLVEKVDNLIFGGEIEIPPAVMPVKAESLKKYVGTYELPSGAKFDVKASAGCLKLLPFGQEAISTLVFIEQKDLPFTVQLNDQAGILLKAAVAGDYKPLRDSLQDEKKVELFVQFVQMGIARFAEEIGAIREVESLGTLPGPLDRENALQTIVKLKGEKEDLLLSVIWQNGKVAGIEPLMVFSKAVGETSFCPLENSNEFAGYNLGIAKTVRLGFSEDSRGSIAGLSIRGKKNVEAVRVNN